MQVVGDYWPPYLTTLRVLKAGLCLIRASYLWVEPNPSLLGEASPWQKYPHPLMKSCLSLYFPCSLILRATKVCIHRPPTFSISVSEIFGWKKKDAPQATPCLGHMNHIYNRWGPPWVGHRPKNVLLQLLKLDRTAWPGSAAWPRTIRSVFFVFLERTIRLVIGSNCHFLMSPFGILDLKGPSIAHYGLSRLVGQLV